MNSLRGYFNCKMKNGGLVKIRVDMLSDRPHAMNNYQLQGTNGAYESARSHGMGEKNRVWLRSKSPTPAACQSGVIRYDDVSMSAPLTSSGVQSGWWARICAAAPETTGAANEVPDIQM